jgi:SAM-dependent methyltransferase
MDGSFSHLRLYSGGEPAAADLSAEAPALLTPDPVAPSAPDPVGLANRELIRPPTYRRGHHKIDPFTAAWFDELEHKRYARHGGWLPAVLEFGRHPGESVLLLNPGVGSDAARYLRQGTGVTIAAGPADHPQLIRENLARHGLTARVVPVSGPALPFADGAFDVVVLNALYTPVPDPAALADELFRVLKAGGKTIGLFPAYYDAGFWQDALLPLQRLYWRRPPDPTSAPKTTRRELRRAFARFAGHRVVRRHLRRSELPHLCRIFPLVALERLIGRVLVFKAFKPISAARTAVHSPITPDALAA